MYIFMLFYHTNDLVKKWVHIIDLRRFKLYRIVEMKR